jgi:hypothetical protein
MHKHVFINNDMFISTEINLLTKLTILEIKCLFNCFEKSLLPDFTLRKILFPSKGPILEIKFVYQFKSQLTTHSHL